MGRGGAQRSIGTAGADANRLTVDELDYLVGAITPCWTAPPGLALSPAALVVMRMDLAIDGSVLDADVVWVSDRQYFQASKDAARRAVFGCGPYALPAHKYEGWKSITINFEP